jgi:hypothetical protein
VSRNPLHVETTDEKLDQLIAAFVGELETEAVMDSTESETALPVIIIAARPPAKELRRTSRRFAPLRKRSAFVAGNDGIEDGLSGAENSNPRSAGTMVDAQGIEPWTSPV